MVRGRRVMTGAMLAMALSGALVAAPSNASAPSGPNVLVILTDDQRVGTMEVMPATQEFFSAGKTYSSAFVTTPQCCPSRASILSGKYIHNHGVLSNPDAEHFDHTESWPRLLNDAGYRTGYFGKYLNAWDPAEPLPNFDESFLGFNRQHEKSSENSSAFITQKAKRFIRSADEGRKPWAAQLALRAPHAPAMYPPEFEEMEIPPWKRSPAVRERNFADKHPDLAFARKPKLSFAQVRAGQLKMLAAADAALAGLYRTLQRTGELDETLVVFTSDNGFYWGEHQLSGKRLPYLDSLRVPLLIRGPGFEPGESDQIAANIDLAPTILDVAGLAPDYPIDGKSLRLDFERPWLLIEGPGYVGDDEFPLWRHGYLSKETHYFEWRDSSEEYYDLTRDPFELRNRLAGDGPPPSDLRAIREAVDKAARCAGARCP